MAGHLLDTSVVLWWLADQARLPEHVRAIIADGANDVRASAAVAWEMAIKKSIGRLEIPGNLEAVLAADHIELMPITAAHALAVADLPLHHQDPFDRIQVAQARLESLTIITSDPRFAAYDVETLTFRRQR